MKSRKELIQDIDKLINAFLDLDKTLKQINLNQDSCTFSEKEMRKCRYVFVDVDLERKEKKIKKQVMRSTHELIDGLMINKKTGLPHGVVAIGEYKKRRFRAHGRINGKHTQVGVYETAEEAGHAFIEAKELAESELSDTLTP